MDFDGFAERLTRTEERTATALENISHTMESLDKERALNRDAHAKIAAGLQRLNDRWNSRWMSLIGAVIAVLVGVIGYLLVSGTPWVTPQALRDVIATHQTTQH